MTDLTDRMRTCAAAILLKEKTASVNSLVMEDAANLLIEASNALEAIPEPLGEPMEIIEPPPPGFSIDRTPSPAWKTTPPPKQGLLPKIEEPTQGTWIAPGDTLPQPRGHFNPRACPKCDSHASKRVRRVDNKLMLECPACGTTWEWKR